MKTLKVGIASDEDMKTRTMAIARGEVRPKPSDPKVWFTSPESFAMLLSNFWGSFHCDLPPINRTRDISKKSITLENDGHENEQIQRRANHWFPAAS